MSSLLTNVASMTALQTLRMINTDLKIAEDQVSTGKKIATAKDNAGIWSIGTVMESDVMGFQAISESLGLGNSALNVALSASSSVVETLKKMKQSIVAAQEDNVDRLKINNDVQQLKNQIKGIIDSAQFNGLNLLKGTDAVEVLASLNRSTDGTVTPQRIELQRQTLEDSAHTFGAGTTVAKADAITTDLTSIAVATAGTPPAADTPTTSSLVLATRNANAGDSFSVELTIPADFGVTGATAATIKIEYVAKQDENQDSILKNLKTLVDVELARNNVVGLTTAIKLAANGAEGELQFTNSDTTNAITVATDFKTDGVRGGGLELISDLSVANKTEARMALIKVEALISNAIDASAAIGSTMKRMEVQVEFISRMKDALKSGIGNLVDADMEEAAAYLQAKQVQQQLGIKALSIANQQPQSLLALFQ